MKQSRWHLILGIVLVTFSLIVYFFQFFTFHNLHDTLFYMLQDLAFVPIQVLLVMLLLDRLLQKKEKESLLNKMNMTIGVFFSEVGTGLISVFAETEKNISSLRNEMMIDTSWGLKRFDESKKFLKTFMPDVTVDPALLGRMKEYLLSRRRDLLQLLENPNLLEHDAFTDLLWAVFHLTDELYHRASLDTLPDPDLNHLRGDISRAYKLIVGEWLEYMKHLKSNYPYLYSIAVRTNPFNPDAKIEVSE
jgi:hypothetical protein